MDFLKEFSDLKECGNWYKVEAITTFQNFNNIIIIIRCFCQEEQAVLAYGAGCFLAIRLKKWKKLNTYIPF